MQKGTREPSFEDTIVAVATPIGSGGIGVIRLSGPDCLKILRKLFRHKPKHKSAVVFPPRKLLFGSIVDLKGRVLDSAMGVYMKAPNSFTGEDVVEIHMHSSPPLLEAVVNIAIRLGARLAEKGEFSRRAFINGKMDLAQAEAVIDLVTARTASVGQLAAAQLAGGLSKLVNKTREKLKILLSKIEAEIDFPDDVVGISGHQISAEILSAQKDIDKLLGRFNLGKLLRNGAMVAIVGRPNVGKSSLLNTLLREERAIVTSEPGTTRDSIEEAVNINGLPVRLVDTAGIRRARGEAEARGILRSEEMVLAAELIMLVVDASRPLAAADVKLYNKYSMKNCIVVFNKIDLGKKREAGLLKAINVARAYVSARTGEGIGGLEKAIYRAIVGGVGRTDANVLINNRHQQCLLRAKASLRASWLAIRRRQEIDIISLGIKDALMALGEVTGEVVTEEILSNIFENFCVGK